MERSKSKASKTSKYSSFIQHISEKYSQYLQSKNQEMTLLTISFPADDWSEIEEIFIDFLEFTYSYLSNDLNLILNVEENKNFDLKKYLKENTQVDFVGIRTNSTEFFLSYARHNGLSDYVYILNDNGFLVVDFVIGITVFRRTNKSKYKELLPYFPESFNELENVLYTIEAPKETGCKKNNLLVIFSNTHKSNENMAERYYSHPYPFIANKITPNTYIVRIADLALAFGSHCLNTKFDDEIEENIQRFIKKLIDIYDIDKENVIIIGSSSGATSALYHGLIGNYKTLAVDPFLGNIDTYYRGKDILYIHSLSKPILDIFDNLPNKLKYTGEPQIIILTAKASEFYPEVKKLKNSIPAITLYEFNSKKIKGHIGLAGVVNFLAETIINNLILNIDVPDSEINLTEGTKNFFKRLVNRK